MTDEIEQQLKRLAKRYAGSEDPAALFASREWKETNQSNLEVYDGDEDAAFEATLQALSVNVTKNATVPGHFFANITGRNKGEEYRASLVIMPDGRTKRVGDGSFEGAPLQPVNVVGMRVTEDFAENVTEYRGGKETKVVAADHENPLPNVEGFGKLAAVCREQRRKGELIVGELNDVLASATVVNEQGHGIFVNDDEESFRYGVEFHGKSEDGGYAKSSLSPAKFESLFGFSPLDDIERTKAAMEGQEFIGLGHFSILTNLPEAVEKQFQVELEAIVRDQMGPRGGKGKNAQQSVLLRPGTLNGPQGSIPIVAGYTKNDGTVALQTDVQALGYTPEFVVEPQVFSKGTPKEFTKYENATIVFPNVRVGKPPVHSRFKQMRVWAQQASKPAQ